MAKVKAMTCSRAAPREINLRVINGLAYLHVHAPGKTGVQVAAHADELLDVLERGIRENREFRGAAADAAKVE